MTRLIGRILVLGSLVALATPPASLAQTPPPSGPLTLERAVDRFLARNLAVEAARYRVDATRAERLTAGLRPNPTLTLSAEDVKLSGPTPAGDLYEVTSNLSYPIELGDKRRLRVEAADASVAVAEAQFADVLRQRLADVKRAFYEVLIARATRDHALETRQTFDALVELNQVRLEEGVVAEGELLKVRLERGKHEAALTDAELALRQAGIKLLDLLGESDFSAAGTVTGTLNVTAMVPPLEDLRAAALQDRPSLQASQHAVALAARRVALERARATVDVSPFLGLRRLGENNTILLSRSRVIRDAHDSFVVSWLKRWYARVLEWTLRHPGTVVVVGVAMLVLALVSVPFMGREFLPPFNEGTLNINATLPPGTSLAESNRIGAAIERVLRKTSEVVSTMRRTGRAEQDEHAAGVNTSELEVVLRVGSRAHAAVLEEIRQNLARLPGVDIEIGQPISHRIDHLLSGTRAQIAIKLFGPDLGVLRTKAGEIRDAMTKIAGVVDLLVEPQVGVSQVQVNLDRRAAAAVGLRADDLAETVEMAFS